MKLPRWLSPVRTVEAETGWPRGVCERVVSALEPTRSLRVLGSVAVALPAAPLFWFVLVALMGTDRSTQLLAILALGAAYASLACIIGLALRSRSVERNFRRYLAEPRCLECRYPTPPGTERVACSRCPECGEPIPPEIAKLAAAQAGQ